MKMTDNSSVLPQEKWCRLAKQSCVTLHNSFPDFLDAFEQPSSHKAPAGMSKTLNNRGEAEDSSHTEMRPQGCVFPVVVFVLQDPSNVGKLVVPVPFVCVSCNCWFVRQWWELNLVKSTDAWWCEQMTPAPSKALVLCQTGRARWDHPFEGKKS